MRIPDVEIVIPVTWPRRDLALSVLQLHAFLGGSFPLPFRAHITVAAGGTSDGTWSTARSLAYSFAEVSAVQVAPLHVADCWRRDGL